MRAILTRAYGAIKRCLFFCDHKLLLSSVMVGFVPVMVVLVQIVVTAEVDVRTYRLRCVTILKVLVRSTKFALLSVCFCL